MNWIEAVALGLVQGLTEFLPVSSSGHLVLTQEAFGMNSPGVAVEVLLHVATLLAVAVVYRRKLQELLVGVVRRESASLRYVLLLVAATIPAGVIGLTLDDMIESAFGSITFVGVNLIVTGMVLWTTRWAVRRQDQASDMGARAAWLMGFAQAAAILPGISRSGSTITAGLWLRVPPVKAAEFSFLMAIPTIAGAAVLKLPDLGSGVEVAVGPLALAFVVSLLSGVWAIKFLVRLLDRSAFHAFAPYCWLAGAVALFWGLSA